MKTRTKALATLACIGLLLLGSCDEPPLPSAEIRPVRTVVAASRAKGELVSLTGHIRARTEGNLAFRIDGRMTARRADVGEAVLVGDVVAELDSQPQQDALRAAKAGFASAQAVLTEATNNMERQRGLLHQGWSTAVRYDAAEKAFRSAEAEVNAAAARLHTAEDQLGYTRLQADASGVVIATGAEAGEVVRAGQMIVRLAQDDGVDAVFDVPANLTRQISPDVSIGIALTDDPAIQTSGRVREVAPQADPVTRSFQIKVELSEKPEAMRLGSTVSGHVRMPATGGIELPATALTTAKNRPAVWVIDSRTMQVSPRPVELLRHGSSSIVVASGLEEGERVVTAGVHALRPGQKVRLEEVAP